MMPVAPAAGAAHEIDPAGNNKSSTAAAKPEDSRMLKMNFQGGDDDEEEIQVTAEEAPEPEAAAGRKHSQSFPSSSASADALQLVVEDEEDVVDIADDPAVKYEARFRALDERRKAEEETNKRQQERIAELERFIAEQSMETAAGHIAARSGEQGNCGGAPHAPGAAQQVEQDESETSTTAAPATWDFRPAPRRKVQSLVLSAAPSTVTVEGELELQAAAADEDELQPQQSQQEQIAQEVVQLQQQLALVQEQEKGHQEELREQIRTELQIELQRDHEKQMALFCTDTLHMLEHEWMKHEDLRARQCEWLRSSSSRVLATGEGGVGEDCTLSAEEVVGGDKTSKTRGLVEEQKKRLESLEEQLRTAKSDFAADKRKLLEEIELARSQREKDAKSQREKEEDTKRLLEQKKKEQDERMRRVEEKVIAEFEAKLIVQIKEKNALTVEKKRLREKLEEREAACSTVEQTAADFEKKMHALEESLTMEKAKLESGDYVPKSEVAQLQKQAVDDARKKIQQEEIAVYVRKLHELQEKVDGYEFQLCEKSNDCELLESELEEAKLWIENRRSSEEDFTKQGTKQLQEKIKEYRKQHEEEKEKLKSEKTEIQTALEEQIAFLQAENDRLLCEKERIENYVAEVESGIFGADSPDPGAGGGKACWGSASVVKEYSSGLSSAASECEMLANNAVVGGEEDGTADMIDAEIDRLKLRTSSSASASETQLQGRATALPIENLEARLAGVDDDAAVVEDGEQASSSCAAPPSPSGVEVVETECKDAKTPDANSKATAGAPPETTEADASESEFQDAEEGLTQHTTRSGNEAAAPSTTTKKKIDELGLADSDDAESPIKSRTLDAEMDALLSRKSKNLLEAGTSTVVENAVRMRDVQETPSKEGHQQKGRGPRDSEQSIESGEAGRATTGRGAADEENARDILQRTSRESNKNRTSRKNRVRALKEQSHYAFETMVSRMEQARKEADERVKTAEQKLELETKTLMAKVSHLEEQNDVLEVRSQTLESELAHVLQKRDEVALELKKLNQQSQLTEQSLSELRGRFSAATIAGVVEPHLHGSRFMMRHVFDELLTKGLRAKCTRLEEEVAALKKRMEEEKATAEKSNAAQARRAKAFEAELKELGYDVGENCALPPKLRVDELADAAVENSDEKHREETEDDDEDAALLLEIENRVQLNEVGRDEAATLLSSDKLSPLFTLSTATCRNVEEVAGALDQKIHLVAQSVETFPQYYSKEFRRSKLLRKWIKGMQSSILFVENCVGMILDLAVRQNGCNGSLRNVLFANVMERVWRRDAENWGGCGLFALWQAQNGFLKVKYDDALAAADDEGNRAHELEKQVSDLELAVGKLKKEKEGLAKQMGSSGDVGAGGGGAGGMRVMMTPVKQGGPSQPGSAMKATPGKGVIPANLDELHKRLEAVGAAASPGLAANGKAAAKGLAPPEAASSSKGAPLAVPGAKGAPPPDVPGGVIKGAAPPVPGGKGAPPPVPGGGKGAAPAVPGGKGAVPAVPGGKGAAPAVPGGKGPPPPAVPGTAAASKGAPPPVPGGNKGATPPTAGKGAPPPAKGAAPPAAKGAAPPAKGGAPPAKGAAAPAPGKGGAAAAPGAKGDVGKGAGKGGGKKGKNAAPDIPVHEVPPPPDQHVAKALHWQKLMPKQYEKSIFAKLVLLKSGVEQDGGVGAAPSAAAAAALASPPTPSASSTGAGPVAAPASAASSPPSSATKVGLMLPGSSRANLRAAAGAAGGVGPPNFGRVMQNIAKSKLSKVSAHFFQKAKQKDGTGADGAGNNDIASSKKKSKELTCLLEDGGKAQNIEIALKSRAITAEQVKSRLDDYDTAALSFESLQIVVSMYPTSEEILQLKKEVPANSPPLRRADDFLLQLLQITHFKLKADCASHVELFPKTFEEVTSECDLLQRACEKVLQSQALQIVFFLVMQIGNFLNYGTAKGAAFGFGLDTLSKLGETSAFGQKDYTLAHALCEELWGESRDTLKAFLEDTADCEAAGRVDFTDTKKRSKELETQIEFVRKSVGIEIPVPGQMGGANYWEKDKAAGAAEQGDVADGSKAEENSEGVPVETPSAASRKPATPAVTPLFGAAFTKGMTNFVLEKRKLTTQHTAKMEKLGASSESVIEFLAAKNGTTLSEVFQILGKFRKTISDAMRSNQERMLKERKRKEKEEDARKRVAEKLMLLGAKVAKEELATVGGDEAVASRGAGEAHKKVEKGAEAGGKKPADARANGPTTVEEFIGTGLENATSEATAPDEPCSTTMFSPIKAAAAGSNLANPLATAAAGVVAADPPGKTNSKPQEPPAGSPALKPASSANEKNSNGPPGGDDEIEGEEENLSPAAARKKARKSSNIVVDGERMRRSTLMRTSGRTKQQYSSSDSDEVEETKE